MLNISPNKLNRKVDLGGYKAYQKVCNIKHAKWLNRFLLAFSLLALIMMFLPWTQNVSGTGFITTLSPDQRPQTIESQIPGRIEKWFVKEGDYVNRGDTILFISEVKDSYFDPKLLDRTQQQISAKEMAVTSYQGKVGALQSQITALDSEFRLKSQQQKIKLKQASLKVESDSINFEVAKTNNKIAQKQYDRILTLNQEGLKSLTEVEMKRLKLQETQAKLISQENALLASKNQLINAQVEVDRIQASYSDKVSKARSDMFTAQSNQFDAEGQLAKMQNQFANYNVRNDLLYVRAPQSGYINRAIKGGVGVTFKEGEELVGILPAQIDMAVETFIDPIDLPLVNVGEKVRIQFDGWPTIVFSGWPNASYGTFGGTVVAIETYISDNGKYRVLLAPDANDQPWPKGLRVGSGARTLALLQDVPIWFELWRQLNGFPPNYYKPSGHKNSLKDKG